MDYVTGWKLNRTSRFVALFGLILKVLLLVLLLCLEFLRFLVENINRLEY